MAESEKIYILGCGAIGLSLAAHLSHAGRPVVAVHATKKEVATGKQLVLVHGADKELTAAIETISLSGLAVMDGTVVVAAKSYANPMIAAALKERRFAGPIVILQNGLGVEDPFVGAGFAEIYRCVLYVTAQMASENTIMFRPITSCPIGNIDKTLGDGCGLERCVRRLSTPGFSFHGEPHIQRDIWKKVIINSVFNSICPLLDTDNGIFIRDEEAFRLAEKIVTECLVLAGASGVPLAQSDLMEQICRISRGSQGVLISTLQDIRNGRDTEIRSLNLALARLAAAMNLSPQLTCTELLGQMVLIKSGTRNHGTVACDKSYAPGTT